jgi:hypothetical protein
LRDYEKISFLKANLVLGEEENIADYSQALNILHKWLISAIDLRCHDVVSRKNEIERLIWERSVAIQKSEDRT